MRSACDGHGLLEAFRASVARLEEHVDEINGLNVYPVPDGDTGSNMLSTVRAALDEADRLAEPTLDNVAAAITSGALVGARGNSGVILSQIFRGMADGLRGNREFNGLDLAHALAVGSRTAYKAVATPVEGTILTVIREASEGAVGAAERSNDVESVLSATLVAAEASLARTPSLLQILRDAGVVDAGGAGLVRLFEGALQHVAGTAPLAQARRRVARPAVAAHMDQGFGYETMYLLLPRQGASLDVEAIRGALQSMGDSVLVAGDPGAVKVHAHSNRPDAILAYGLTHGTLSRISVENLDAQAIDVREERARAFTEAAGSDTESPAVTASGRITVSAAVGATVTRAQLAVVAVASGDGLAAIFQSCGCTRIVSGGHGTNPSTGELLAAVDEVNADHVMLLPNNPNVVLAARQVADLRGGAVTVVPTRNAAEGLAALLALDPASSVAVNADSMSRAARSIQSLQVTQAVRDAEIGNLTVTKGQVIVLNPDDGLVAVDGDEARAVIAGIGALSPGYELLTIYYGDGADLASAEALGRRITEQRPGVEVEIVRGGQPHYRYLIAAE